LISLKPLILKRREAGFAKLIIKIDKMIAQREKKTEKLAAKEAEKVAKKEARSAKTEMNKINRKL